MSRFDRYLLSQFLMLFGFFALILVAVYWVNRAVSLFDRLIGDGQSALVFLEMTALTLPNVIRMVLPVAAFAASAYVTNRLSRESELVVMQATGFSSFRLARPVFYFGLIVALIMMVLVNVLVPASRQALSERQAAITENVTSRMLRPGVFQFPVDGITLYIRDITETGELRDIYLSDARNPEARTSYTSKRGYLSKNVSGPKLVLVEGMAQTLSFDGMRISITRFADFTYDLDTLFGPGAAARRDDGTLSTWELLTADEALAAETGRSRSLLIWEGHNRLAQPFLATAAALIGFSALLIGAFSRFGLWRQLLGGSVGLVVVQMIANSAESVGVRDARLWPLVWAAPLMGIALSAVLLWWSQRETRPRRALT
ncbi:LPS export ABC transporter permease LptF [Falsigemmobacter faecalis]|uniref:LPS export ABC transporter permease LptF n=1 Tax=Falsigemmobacter faecalis TaxID=2488730 RepID=A0A3P3DEA9_9RHOB|nr:LPS export ABC transporter permease LptF [Falsigemmobacter faecalis]RRH72611.1 LPS export ABC transporter permease LptF [Falsigemmobacter faecalis]